MEREPIGCDARLLRAARSLYVNRRNRELVESRIERASEQLLVYLGLNGITAARLGVFDISLLEGEVRVAKSEAEGARQLELPRLGEREHLAAGPGSGPESGASYDAPGAGGELVIGDEVEMLMLLKRFVADVSRHYETRTGREALEALTIKSPQEAYEFLAPEMAHLQQEQLRVLNLNIKNRVLSAPMIYQGTVSATTVRAGEIFRPAVTDNAFAIIVAHNHPSGIPDPSPEDIQLTRQLVEVGKLLDIELLDHVIVASSGYTSLREQGLGFR